MIPKIIHYCWFGNKPIPELDLQYISSWKKYLPDYELRLWNEKTFDLDMYPYAREAYDNRKFAFVTDVVRLWALEQYGGIYMDTDVEVLKPLDEFLTLPAFTGYEKTTDTAYYPVTGIMASEAGNIWVKEQLKYYEKKHFIQQDGTFDITPNTETITNIMRENGFVVNGEYGVYKKCMHIFPSDYFCPKQWNTGEIHITPNTYCIHHFAGSWKKPTTLQSIFIFIRRCWRWGLKRIGLRKLLK